MQFAPITCGQPNRRCHPHRRFAQNDPQGFLYRPRLNAGRVVRSVARVCPSSGHYVPMRMTVRQAQPTASGCSHNHRSRGRARNLPSIVDGNGHGIGGKIPFLLFGAKDHGTAAVARGFKRPKNQSVTPVLQKSEGFRAKAPRVPP